MPISGTKTKGCKDLLKLLKDDELFSLADTVTKKHVEVKGSKKEAIKAILSFSTSVEELLNRQKISRDLLFKYLTTQKVFPSINSRRPELIAEVLKLWGNDAQVQPSSLQVSALPAKSSAVPAKSSAVPAKASAVPAKASAVPAKSSAVPAKSSAVPAKASAVPAKSSAVPAKASAVPAKASAIPAKASSPRSTSGQALPVVEIKSQSTYTYSPTINYIVNNQYNEVSVNSSSHVEPVEQEVQTLGKKFTVWFFDALNSHNLSKSPHTKDFGPQHFLDDAELFLLQLGPTESREKFCGQQAVSDRFLAFVKGEDLLFNPNSDHGGILVDTNPHGLVVVLVCGTVHRGNQCLGVFEQMFGLIKDPRFDNNWKIKISKLKMSAMAVSQLPKLTDKSPAEIQDLARV